MGSVRMLAPKEIQRKFAADADRDGSLASPEQSRRLGVILDWLLIAKESMPEMNEGAVKGDRIAALSALVDRLHGVAVSLRDGIAGRLSE